MSKFEHKASQAKGLGDIVAYINAFRTTTTLQQGASASGNPLRENEKEDFSDEGGQYAN